MGWVDDIYNKTKPPDVKANEDRAKKEYENNELQRRVINQFKNLADDLERASFKLKENGYQVLIEEPYQKEISQRDSLTMIYKENKLTLKVEPEKLQIIFTLADKKYVVLWNRQHGFCFFALQPDQFRKVDFDKLMGDLVDELLKG